MKVLILAGGYDQIQLINEYKNRGYETILVDYFENPPAKSCAHKHYQVSTLDIDAVKEIAIKEEVDLVMTACTDQALVTMAKVSEDLGLPCYLTYETACKVTNKLLMKKLMVENHIPTAAFCVVEHSKEVQGVEFPAVVKPLDANSSKGVERVYSYEELAKAIEVARNYSRQNEVIVEEYKVGEELSVDVWVEDGKGQIMCISQSEKRQDDKKFTIIQSKYPCQISQDEETKLLDIINQIIRAFDINRGPMLVQMIKNNSDFNVIEFSARYGGGTKYKLIEAVSGLDPIKTIVDLSVGVDEKVDLLRSKRCFHMNYVYCNPGQIKEFRGFEEAYQKGLIDDYFYYKTSGMTIEKIENSSDRAAGYMVSGDTIEELLEREKLVEEMIAVTSQEGKNMIRCMLYDQHDDKGRTYG